MCHCPSEILYLFDKEEMLKKLLNEFIFEQEELGEEFKYVLMNNLFNLYVE